MFPFVLFVTVVLLTLLLGAIVGVVRMGDAFQSRGPSPLGKTRIAVAALLVMAVVFCHRGGPLYSPMSNVFFAGVFIAPMVLFIALCGNIGLFRRSSLSGDFLVTWLACTLSLGVVSLNHFAFSLVSLYSISASLKIAVVVAVANAALLLALRILSVPLNALTLSLSSFLLSSAGLLAVPVLVSETYLRSHWVTNLWPAAIGGLLMAFIVTVQAASFEDDPDLRLELK